MHPSDYDKYHKDKKISDEKDKRIEELEESLKKAKSREILAFYWGQDSEYFEFLDYEQSEDYLKQR